MPDNGHTESIQQFLVSCFTLFYPGEGWVRVEALWSRVVSFGQTTNPRWLHFHHLFRDSKFCLERTFFSILTRTSLNFFPSKLVFHHVTRYFFLGGGEAFTQWKIILLVRNTRNWAGFYESLRRCDTSVESADPGLFWLPNFRNRVGLTIFGDAICLR